MKNTKIRLSDTLEITERLSEGVYEYYIGRSFVFGVLKPFTVTELTRLFINGYFDPFISKEARV